MSAAARAQQAGRPSINFSADVSPLIKAISWASTGAMDRTSIPILNNILVQAAGGKLLVVGADMDREVEVEIDAKVGIEGATTMPLRTFGDLVRGYPAGGEVEVGLGPRDSRAAVSCGRSRSMLPTLDADQFPRIRVAGSERLASFDLDTDTLERMIDKVAFVAGEETGKPHLLGMHIHTVDTEDGRKLRAVATDGYQLAVAEADAPEGLDFAAGVTLAAKTVSCLRKLTQAGGEMTTIQVTQSLIEFNLRQVRMTSKVIGYAYADYNRFYPEKYGPTVIVDKALMTAALDRALLFATTTNRRLKLDLEPGVIKTTARTYTTGELDDEITVDYDGEPFTVVFNAKRLKDIITHIDDPRVEIAFTTGKTVFRIRGEGSKSEHYLMQPIPDGQVEVADDK